MSDNIRNQYSDRLAGIENDKQHLNINFFSSKSLSKQIRILKTDVEDKSNFLTIYQRNLTAQNESKHKFFHEKIEQKIPKIKYSTNRNKSNIQSEESNPHTHTQTFSSKFKILTELPNKTKYNRRLIQSPTIKGHEYKDSKDNNQISSAALSPSAQLLERENAIEKLVSKQHIDNLIFKNQVPTKFKLSSRTTNVHSQVTDRTNDDQESIPNLKKSQINQISQINHKANISTISSSSPLKAYMKSTNNSFFNKSHTQSKAQFFHTKKDLETLTEQQKKQKEIDNLYDKIFSTKRSLYKEPKTNKDCHVMFTGAEKVYVPKKSRYIKDKIKDIYKKISFMKGVFDYAFPKIMVVKVKQNQKEYEEFIDRFHDNIYEKNKKLEKKFKTQNTNILNKMTDPTLPSEKEVRNTHSRTDSNYMNTITQNNFRIKTENKTN
jgi:hypothetical protein